MAWRLRNAEAADMAPLLDMCRRFLDASGYGYPWDEAHARAGLAQAMLAADALVLVLDVDGAPRGVLIAQAGPHPFGPVRQAQEVVWWIETDARSVAVAQTMLAAFEGWAAARGCAFVTLALLGEAREAALYRRRGYAPAETHWIRAL